MSEETEVLRLLSDILSKDIYKLNHEINIENSRAFKKVPTSFTSTKVPIKCKSYLNFHFEAL